MSARILVVDDVPANVKLLEARLSAEYFDVLTASNGTEALEICARAECDIILLDVMMPDMDGFEVCRRLKSNPATHFIPVVIVTALDSPADRVRGLEAGADDFLTKPVSDVVLIARVRSLTRLKMMTDELRMRAITSLEIGMQAPERSAGGAAPPPPPGRGGAGGGRPPAPPPPRPPAAASCWSTTGRRPTRSWRRSFPPNTPSTSRPIRRKPCSTPPRAITTS